jgi:hypothetical protein
MKFNKGKDEAPMKCRFLSINLEDIWQSAKTSE